MTTETLTLSGGRTCQVEPERRPGFDRRVFHAFKNDDGTTGWEWAYLKDVKKNDLRARWYAFHPMALPPHIKEPA